MRIAQNRVLNTLGSLTLVCLIAIYIFLSASASLAQDENLPDMGSPADALLSKNLESQIGRQIYNSLVSAGSVVSDPELQEYIQDIGMRLAGSSATDDQRFYFFIVNDPVINAFALPGGYIGVHTGLLLATETESQLAGVLAHEISHVTQRHISRAVLANQRASTLSLAAMLGAILVGVATGADAGVIQGAVGAAQSFTIEQQIKFTRSNEYEADRVGLGVLAAAGFDPEGMPQFFETLGRSTGSLTNRAPEFLLTHPVTSERVAETRARAKQYTVDDVEDTIGYSLARARSRIQSSSRPEVALEYFLAEAQKASRRTDLEINYGIATALLELGEYEESEQRFTQLVATHEEAVPLYSGLAQAQSARGNSSAALATYQEAMELFPRNIPLTVRYAEALLKYAHADEAHEILLDLLNYVPPTVEQVRLIALAANEAGDIADAHYYMAEYHAMRGSLKLGVDQLRLALGIPGLDNVQRARFRARLDEFQNYLMLQERQQRQQRQEN